MSSFDGSDEPLKYGHALAMLADKAPWGSDEQRIEVRDAILKEHGLWVEPPKPDDPHAAFVHETNKELRELREQNARLVAEKAARDQQAEIARLQAENEKLARGEDPQAKQASPTADTPQEVQAYEDMTLPQLRSRLLARELPVSGKKEDLIARLEEADAA